MAPKEFTGGSLLNNESKPVIENDPMEAIFALNLGDFLTEHLISDDLLSKINLSVNDKTTKLKNQLKELITIYSLDKTLTLLGFNSDEDFIIYNSIAKTISQMIDITSCHVFLDKEYIKNSKLAVDKDLVLVGTSTKNINKSEYKHTGYSFNEENNLIVKAFVEDETVYHINVADSQDWTPIMSLEQEKTKTVLAIPLANMSEKIGIMCIENHSEKEIPHEHIKLLKITASLFVTSLRLQELVEKTEKMLEDETVEIMELRHIRTELTENIADLCDEQQMFVEALAFAVDAKSDYERTHSLNVGKTAKEIAEYLKLNEKTTDLIYYAGLLKNIGKIALTEDILTKTGNLSTDDWQKLESHPNVGVNLLMKINFLSEVIPYINYQRERWDGQGLPEGLSGMSIPLGSRIIAVADAYQAMISERPFKKALTNEHAIKILNAEAGIKWDPMIVDAICEVRK